MIDEHEPVIMTGLKSKTLFCDVEKLQIAHSDAQLNMSKVFAHVPVILLLLTCSFKEFEEKSSG